MGPKYVLLFAALLAATGAGARPRIYSFVDADGVLGNPVKADVGS